LLQTVEVAYYAIMQTARLNQQNKWQQKKNGRKPKFLEPIAIEMLEPPQIKASVPLVQANMSFYNRAIAYMNRHKGAHFTT